MEKNMADILVTVVLPNGGARQAEMPDDIQIRDLVPELVGLLQLPTIGPDGRPMGYRLDSKALGRELNEDETLGAARIPGNDHLILTADITAGAVTLDQSPRMRRLWADYQLMKELVARSELIEFSAKSVRPELPPESYLVTYHCKGIIGVNRQGHPKFGNQHQVEIYLHNQYPQRWPGMKWLTPIWHPNINHLNGTVCIDAAWWTASRSLDRLILMIGEMVQYKNFHDDPTRPPFPWDPEAARWSRAYRQEHPDAFPVDQDELLKPEKIKIRTSKISSPALKPKKQIRLK
jgi:ubiquitin-protein ligase